MPATLDQLKADAMRLPTRERAELAKLLLSSLDPEAEEVEAAWKAEVGRRVDEILSGRAAGKPAEQLFAELREAYP
jgi:putative addiction module component (TIGR02574 family)